MQTSYYCTIKDGYTIGMEGVINVHDSDIKNFCNNGCYDHTLYVLTCIKDVKSDFFFQTKQPVSYVWNVTSRACANQLNGNNFFHQFSYPHFNKIKMKFYVCNHYLIDKLLTLFYSNDDNNITCKFTIITSKLNVSFQQLFLLNQQRNY